MNIIGFDRWLTVPRQLCIDHKKIQTTSDSKTYIQQILTYVKNKDAVKVAIYFDNTYNFIAAFYALVLLDLKPLLLSYVKDKFLEENLNGYDLILTDNDLGYKRAVNVRDIKCEDMDLLDVDFTDLHLNDRCFYLQTSGSTQNPKLILKSIEQMDAESATLITMLKSCYSTAQKGFKSSDTSIMLGSVFPNHMYGLTFRVFLCMNLGLFFDASLIHYSEELLKYKNKNIVFISSPAFLKRLDPAFDYRSIVHTFSAGGAIDKEVAKAYQSKSGSHITEIYGSSETGVIAYKSHPDLSMFRLFDGVEIVKSDESFILSSKMAGSNIVLDDVLDFVSKTDFAILGRKDRIVKIEEKRISISLIERYISELEAVCENKVVVLNRKGRDILGVVVVAADKNIERKELLSQIKDYLRSRVDNIAIPRMIRIIDGFKHNTMGKILNADLLELFNE